MQPVKLLTIAALLLASLPGDAAYVQSGKQTFASSRSSTVCSPGTVTAGHMIVMIALMNTSTSITISSTRVTTWVQDQHAISAPSNFYLFHGVATSSGSESITVALTSGTTFAGSACAEYTNPTLDATGGATGIPITTTAAVTDIIASGFNASGGTYTMSAPFTTRQSIDDGAGNVYMIYGDQSVTSAGSYNFPSTAPSSTMRFMDAFAAAAGSTTSRHQLFYR